MIRNCTRGGKEKMVDDARSSNTCIIAKLIPPICFERKTTIGGKLKIRSQQRQLWKEVAQLLSLERRRVKESTELLSWQTCLPVIKATIRADANAIMKKMTVQFMSYKASVWHIQQLLCRVEGA